MKELKELIEKYNEVASLCLQYVPAEGKNEFENKEIEKIHNLIRDIAKAEKDLENLTSCGQNYTKVWNLLKEARDEADFEELERISAGIEILLELIRHRCAEHRKL